jgi:Ca2+-binding EF-hand superfamily protein
MTARTTPRVLLAIAAATLSLSSLAAVPDDGIQAVRPGGPGWMLQQYDTDGDGMITLQEFQAAGDLKFARLDADGDGRISVEEFAAASRRWAGRTGGPRSERYQGPKPRQEQFRARMFQRMDADGDGYVSKAEWDNARLARFSALDVNGNGAIDAEELPQRAHRREGWHADCAKRGYGPSM